MSNPEVTIWYHSKDTSSLAVLVEADKQALAELSAGLNTREANKIRTQLRHALKTVGAVIPKGKKT